MVITITIETSFEIVEYGGVDNEVKERNIPLNHNICVRSVKYDLALKKKNSGNHFSEYLGQKRNFSETCVH